MSDKELERQLADPEVRRAIQVLRQKGLTPTQFEEWTKRMPHSWVTGASGDTWCHHCRVYKGDALGLSSKVCSRP